MFDHISNAIKDIVIVILCVPHEGRSADHFVLLIHIGFVKTAVKVQAQHMSEQKHTKIQLTNIYSKHVPWKGYVWLADIVTGTHALHRLHHVCVRPVPPASIFIPLIAHGHLNPRKHTAGQHRRHAGQSETGAGSQFRFLPGQD